MNNNKAIESLRTFALSQCVASCHPHDYADNSVYVRFAKLCDAALAGEKWAVERLDLAVRGWAIAETHVPNVRNSLVLGYIRNTETTPPVVVRIGNSVARAFQF